MAGFLNRIYERWLIVFPFALLVTLFAGLFQITVNGAAGEDFLAWLFFLFVISIATAVSLAVSLLIGKFGKTGLTLVLLAVVATLATVLVQTYSSGSPSVSISGYGFPLSWMVVTTGSAFQKPSTEYSELFFILDTAFFAIVGYFATSAYVRTGHSVR